MMIEKGRISASQMAIIMYPAIAATAILLVPAITARHAGRDMWLSPIWAAAIGLLSVGITWWLHRFFPQETIVEYSLHLIGRIPGKIFGGLFLLFFVHHFAIVTREYTEFIIGSFMHLTPKWVIIGSMMLICAMNVRGGLEVMARSAQIFVPIVMVLFVSIVTLLVPELRPGNMLPMFEHGLTPSILGAIVPMGWFSEFILMAFLLPYLSDKGKGLKWGIYSVLAVMLTMLITNIASLFLFGDLTGNMTYPVMIAARYITYADFFEHLESVAMMIWIGGMFVKMSMFYYTVVLGTAQWLGLREYRHLTLPIGLLMVACSYWLTPNLQELVAFLGTTASFYFLTVQLLLPAILLAAAVVKFKVLRKRGNG